MPPRPRSPSVTLSVRISRTVFAKLVTLSEQTGDSRNALAARAIAEWVDDHKDEAMRLAISHTVERATAERIDLYMRSYLNRIGDLVAASAFGSELAGVLAEITLLLHYGPERKEHATTQIEKARATAAKRLKNRRLRYLDAVDQEVDAEGRSDT